MTSINVHRQKSIKMSEELTLLTSIVSWRFRSHTTKNEGALAESLGEGLSLYNPPPRYPPMLMYLCSYIILSIAHFHFHNNIRIKYINNILIY